MRSLEKRHHVAIHSLSSLAHHSQRKGERRPLLEEQSRRIITVTIMMSRHLSLSFAATKNRSSSSFGKGQRQQQQQAHRYELKQERALQCQERKLRHNRRLLEQMLRDHEERCRPDPHELRPIRNREEWLAEVLHRRLWELMETQRIRWGEPPRPIPAGRLERLPVRLPMLQILVNDGGANLESRIHGDQRLGWQSEEGWTPLHFAADYGNLQVLHWLLVVQGVNPLLQDARGRTALALAVYDIRPEETHRIAMTKLLLQHILLKLKSPVEAWLLLERSVGRLTKRNRPVVEELRVELLFPILRESPHLASPPSFSFLKNC